MLELFAAWRTVVHISEWSGLSIGALAVIAVLVWLDPRILKPAIFAAVGVMLFFGGTFYGDATGRADVHKQWDAARAAAEKARADRDAGVARDLEQKYRPMLDDLTKQAADSKDKADAYERQLAGVQAKAPGGSSCELGAVADRLRKRR